MSLVGEWIEVDDNDDVTVYCVRRDGTVSRQRLANVAQASLATDAPDA
eukprot:CAMPEP_0198346922 /NCGR_PEP_ID=MMETSP1450-20131203/82272_1 /TAXON_ID=753684 ORGANISM="Madagascaria erythrocladiodes, Strain CCMP3234" /NCGR_SAMPLE_ID=MMETSP1450 /ASSEMBLY_ACC=CAM_ASM_001115 /LENGTH=47 /DNA_ID= /DNA_START= /DNA_END= /DNA_ORIENTATION=